MPATIWSGSCRSRSPSMRGRRPSPCCGRGCSRAPSTTRASSASSRVRPSPTGDRSARRRRRSGRSWPTSRFFPVYQPIVSLADRTGRRIRGADQVHRRHATQRPIRPAAAVGLGFEFELAAIEAAIAAAPPIAADGFLSLNVSPGPGARPGSSSAASSSRRRGRIVLELTEHAPIANYEAFRWAVGQLTMSRSRSTTRARAMPACATSSSSDPAWVKLDITLVRGIDTDPLRQALVAGLAHFATRSGAAADRRGRRAPGGGGHAARHRRRVRPGLSVRSPGAATGVSRVGIPSSTATPPFADRVRPYWQTRAMTSVRGALRHAWLYSVPPAAHGRRLFRSGGSF